MAGDEIRAAAGLYTGTVTLGKNLTLQGGFTTTNWITPNPSQNPTIIDAQNSGSALDVSGGVIATVNGFHLTGGNSLVSGGGVNNQGILTLTDDRIYGNTAFGNGGGIANGSAGVAARLTLSRSRIYSNTASLPGGGLAVISGTVLVEAAEIFSNSTASGVVGGGISVVNGDVTVRSSLVYRNSVSNNAGGGIWIQNGNVKLENNTIYDNRSTNGQGGGIGAFQGTVAITNNLILTNTASISGGGIYNYGAALNVAYTDFFGNSPDHMADGSGTINPTTFGSNNRISNPLLVNPPAFDLHLTASSPAIDSGTASTAAIDIDGQGRPFVVTTPPGMDRGADEYYPAGNQCYARLNNSRVYTNVQDAVNAAPSGSLIQVAGICAGVRTLGGVTQTVYISQSLTMRGGYTATDWINPRYGPTILDAQSLGRVVYATGNSVVTLDSLHIRNGSATGTGVDGRGGGIYLGNSVSATLQNNVIHGNRAADGGGVYGSDGSQALLQFNTIYSNTAQQGGGIYVTGAGTLLTLRNTIVATNTATSSGGGISGGSDNTALDYNDFFNSDNYGGGVVAGPHDILSPPGLTNPAGGNFHLMVSSPLINAAEPAATLDHDFDGDTRPQGTRRDIGADESVWYTGVDVGESPTSPVVVIDTSTISGTSITFTHIITNIGNTPGLTDTFVIAPPTNNAGWSVSLIGISPTVVLTQGIGRVFTVVVSVPSSVPAGIYNETIITATSQSNPTGFDMATDVIANPALLLAPSYTENADPGEVVTYTHTLTNIGVADTFTLTVVSSRGWGQLITPTGLITLAHGQTAQIVVQVSVTTTAPVNLADVTTVHVASLDYPAISGVVTDTTIANPTKGDRYVAKSGHDTDNNCTDRDVPCLTIGYAGNQAIWGDTVRVAEGVYSENDIFVNQNIGLQGGFTTGDWTVPDPATHLTVIDAQSKGRVLHILMGGPPTIVGGFTLRNGSTAGVGGAIWLEGTSSLTLTQLSIENVSATQEGGAIYIDGTLGGSPVLQTVVISGARSSTGGGGIYINGGTPLLQGVAISNSTAVNGAGLYSRGGNPVVQHLSVDGSTASGQGGGVYLDSGPLTISQTVASRNTALNGGGIYNRAGSLALWNSIIYSNTATSGGGGGVYNGGTLSMVNDTLYSNHAATQGGGVLHVNNGGLTISNTIVATNTATTYGGIYRTGSGSVATGYNDVVGNTVPESNIAAGSGSIAADPMFVDAAAGDFHLSPGSPAVDSADPHTFLTLDFEDDIRPVNQGFDMGADEVAGCLARVTYPDGSFASGPYGVVQDAVNAAGPHYTVQISGICRGVQQVEGISQTVYISKSLTLEGGYDSQFKPTGSTAVLDAQSLGRVVVVTNTASVVITGLTMIDGDAARSGGDDTGGGIYNYDGILVVQKSTISGSHATSGGGLYNLTGALTLGGDVEDARTYVLSNSATYGGGLYLAGDSPVIRRATIGGNQASQQGGGLYNTNASPILSQTLFYSNTASLGGAIYNADGLLSGQIITATGNTASNGGAVYNATGGQMFLERSMLLSNTATAGGGLFNASGVLTMVNTLVVSNTATGGDGGGLYNAAGSVLALRHDDFYANRASSRGGGIYDGSGAAPVINSNIIISNTASNGGGIYSAANANFDYNDVAGNTGGNYDGGIAAGSHTIGATPTFISLDPTSASFLRIPAGSSVEDKADPASPVTNDIDGDPRPSNQASDIGADEVGGCYVRNPRLGIVYGNIQIAVDAGGAGDQLQVAGICQGVNTRSAVTQTVFISKSLSLQGGYDHNDWTLAPDPAARPTILDALGMGRVAYITNSAVISIDGLHLRQGSVSSDGGGVYLGSGVLTMTHDLVYSSTAARGGGLFNQGGTAYLYLNNQIFTNTATISGGAIYQAGGQITLDDNVLRDNRAASGGAFYQAGGSSLLQNNIIWSNRATNGGGIYNATTGITLTVRHNTIYSNTATTNGGGLFSTNSGSPVVVNNIFLSNTATSGRAVYAPSSLTLRYNDLYTGTSLYAGGVTIGTGNLYVDPLLVNAAAGDFHLQDTSPVIDKGDPTMAEIYDFDGDLRPSNQGFDMGADEWARGCLALVVRTDKIYGNIQRAINNSQPGDEIRVTQGDCRGVHQYQAISQTVHITQSLTLNGMYVNPVFLDPYRGYATPNFNAQYNGGACLDSGSPLTDTLINPLRLGRAVLITNSAVVTMEGFQLLAGSASGLGGRGGALYVASGSRALLNAVDPYSATVANTAQYGGAIYNGGTLILRGVWALSNTATADGGVIYNTGVLTVTSEGALAGRSTNWSDNQAAGRGGSLYNQGGQVWLINLTHQDLITASRALTGGAIYNEGTTLTGTLAITKFELGFNVATYQGGAIYNRGGTLSLQGNDIHDNKATNTSVGNGAGLYNASAGRATLDLGNRFHNNAAGQSGGAIYNSAVMTAWNTLIYSNTAEGTGGGIFDSGSTSSILHNTFYGNAARSATSLGGGLYASAGSHTVENNIFDFNTAPTGSAIYGAAGTLTLGYNDYWPGNASSQVSYTGGAGSNNLNADPLFVDVGQADFHLELGSPVINQALAGLGVLHDFENDPRPINAGPDMGADENNLCLARIARVPNHIYGQIQPAVDDAQTGDTVQVAEGVCEGSISINKAITLSGSWTRNFTSQSNAGISTTIVASPTNRVAHVFGGIDATILRVRLAYGDIAGNGGGILDDANGLTLTNVDVVDNHATSYGGGIYVGANSVLTASATYLAFNSAGVNGGGIYNDLGSDVTLANGGLIGLSHNSATGNGGGMYNNGGDVFVTGGEDSENTATNGGGFYNNGGTFKGVNKWFTSNTASANGGAFYDGGSSVVTLTNVLFYDNLASGAGGALYSGANAQGSLYHDTLNENRAAQGGAVYNGGGATIVISASIVASNVTSNTGATDLQGPMAIAYTLKSPDTDSSGGVVWGVGNLTGAPNFWDPIGAHLDFDSPAIDSVPTAMSNVDVDAYLDSRPLICNKDMGLDEYAVQWNDLSWATPSAGQQGTSLAPGESITYTFAFSNISQHIVDSTFTAPLGTGYTETFTLTLVSSHGWAEIVGIGGGGSVVATDTATISAGPGRLITVTVKVTVPPGTLATVSTDDSTKEFTYLTYRPARPCPVIPSGNSPTVETWVEQQYDFIIEPDHFGTALLPGQTVTFTHVLTNLGNITDTYDIFPKSGFFYATGVIVEPASSVLEDVGPGVTATIVISVTAQPWAGGGVSDIVYATGISQKSPDLLLKSAANNIVISYTTGTRYVAVNGYDTREIENPNITGTLISIINNCTVLEESPCRTIQHAIEQAAPGDEIWISSGVYTNVATATEVVYLNKSVALRGGYDPTWTQPPNPFTYTTTLDGQHERRVIYVPAGYTPTIHYLDLTGGQTTDSGGGLYNAGSDLVVGATAIHHNQANQGGGGLYSAGGDLLLQNNTIYHNQAQNGGGLYVADGSARLENDTFNANTAVNGSGIYNAASMVVTNTILADNLITPESSGTGSAIYNDTGSIALAYNDFYNNESPAFFGLSNPVGSNHNVALEPGFVDANNDDYHLVPDSGLINIGTSAVATTEDFEGDTRPQMELYDIGADERAPRRGLLFYDDWTEPTSAPAVIPFIHTVENLGEITETVTISFTDSLGWPTVFDHPIPYTITLAPAGWPGNSQSVPVTITVPAGTEGLTNVTLITATATTTSVFAVVQDTIHVQSAAWQIGKTVTPSLTVRPGELLTYTLTITNIGELDTSGAYTITDQLPANTTYVSATPAPALTSTTAVTWYASNTVASGTPFTRSLVVRVTQPLTDGTLIVNQTYGITGGQAYTQAWGLPVTVTVRAPASLSITKTASASSLTAGGWLTYTITVSNGAAALGPALGVVVSDTLPNNVVYQSMGFISPATGTITATGSPLLLWQLTDPIAAGGSAQVTAVVRITSPLTSPTVLTNSYGVTATNIPARLSGSITNTVISTNSLSLTKTVQPAIVLPGGVVTYTITLTNTGNGLAHVVLTDVLSTGFNPTLYITNVVVPGRTWNTSSGSAILSFTATAPITTGLYYNRWVTATYDLTGTASISQVAPVSVEAPNPSLLVTKQATPDPVAAGAQLVYTITVTNIGNMDLHTTVTDTLPAHVTPGGVLTWTPTITTPQGTWVQTVTVTTEDGYAGVLTNVVRVTSAEGATGIFTETTTVLNAMLTVDKQANVGTAGLGQTITYTYRVTNTGGVSLTAIIANDDRLGAISLVSNTLEPGQAATGTATHTVQESDLPGPLVNTVTVTGTNLPPLNSTVTFTASESVNLTYTALITIAKTPDGATVRAGDLIIFTIDITNTGDVTLAPITVTDALAGACGNMVPTLTPLGGHTSYTCTMAALPDSFTNTATVAGMGPGGSVAIASDDAFVNVVNPHIAMAKTPASQMARSGETVTFTIFITNTGNVTLSPVTVTDILPSTCDQIIPALTATQAISYPCSMVAGTDDFTNTAIVTGSAPLGELVTDTNSAFVDVIHPDVAIAKTPDYQVAQIDDLVVFTITLTNTGDVDLSTILTDGQAPSCEWTGSLAAYEEKVYTCTVIAPPNDFTNIAVVAATPPDGRIVSASDDAFVNVIAPAVAIAKTPDGQPAISGNPVTFTIFITNTGDADLSAITVTDVLSSTCDRNNLPGLASSESTSYECSLVAGADDFTNTVVVTGAVSTGGIVTNSDTAFVNVLQSGLAIAKTPASQMARVGDVVNFTISVTNTGDVTMTTVAVSDTLDSGCDSVFPDVPSGESRSYICPITVLGDDFTNAVTATGISWLGDMRVVTATAFVDVVTPSIKIAKTPASQVAQSGDPVTFTILVTNTGDVTLSLVAVTDALSSACNNTLGSLAPMGTSAPYTCTIAALADDFFNTAVVTGTPPVGEPVTGTAAALVDVIHPDLVIAKTPDTQMAQGGASIVFTITLTNTGDVPITATVTDALAPACDRASILLANGAPPTPTVYTCTTTALADDFTNTAIVTGTPSVGRALTRTDTAFVDVIHPNFVVAKTPVSQTIASGADATFTVTVANNGDAGLSLVATDALVPACGWTTPVDLAFGNIYTQSCTRTNVTADFTNTVVVTGTPQVGAAQTRVATATVVVVEPIAGLSATNDSPTELGNPTTLTATITAGTHVNYTWDFGDGTTGNGAVLAHTYPATGTFTAVVTASNGISTLTATTTVDIIDRPVAGLNVTSDSPTTLGNTTTLTATAGGSNIVYTWDFGDSSPVVVGSQSVVAHTYSTTGTFTVVVTASNSTNFLTATTTVEVVAPAAPGNVYLPIILRDYVPPVEPTPTPPTPKPDLVVTSLSVTPNGAGGYAVAATTCNQSATAVTFGNNFYVNVYLDPSEPFTNTQLPSPSVTPAIWWGVQASWYGANQCHNSTATCSVVAGGDYGRLHCTWDGTGDSTVDLGPGSQHQFYGWADPYETTPANPGVGTVDESNEDNNTRLFTYIGALSAGHGLDLAPQSQAPSAPGPRPTPTVVP